MIVFFLFIFNYVYFFVSEPLNLPVNEVESSIGSISSPISSNAYSPTEFENENLVLLSTPQHSPRGMLQNCH